MISDKQIWISSGLWIGHLLIPSGAFGHYEHTTVFDDDTDAGCIYNIMVNRCSNTTSWVESTWRLLT